MVSCETRRLGASGYSVTSQPAIGAGDQFAPSVGVTVERHAVLVATRQGWGRLACGCARVSASNARSWRRPPVRRISRLSDESSMALGPTYGPASGWTPPQHVRGRSPRGPHVSGRGTPVSGCEAPCRPAVGRRRRSSPRAFPALARLPGTIHPPCTASSARPSGRPTVPAVRFVPSSHLRSGQAIKPVLHRPVEFALRRVVYAHVETVCAPPRTRRHSRTEDCPSGVGR